MANKQYGLIIPKKSKQAAVKKPSVFDDDSEEERERNTKCQPTEAKIDTWKSKVKKKTQLEMKKVLEEDPTVYEYDSIYDNMQKEKEVKTTEIKSKDRKPKYVESLLKAADSRKKEYERRVERSIQKEREQEGDEFKDKEAFVTTAYKKKMLEMEEQEEKERKEREAEERMDVIKQKDLSGFYRHLLKQTAGEETNTAAGQKEPVVSIDKQDSPENADNSVDNKQSSELIRAKKAVEEMKRNSPENKKENSNKKKHSDSSDEEIHKSSNHLKTSMEKCSQDRTSDDSSSDEGHKRTKRKHKHRHENSRKHKKSKSRHNHSDSEEESRHNKKHKHSKHNRSSHRDDKQKRKDKHRAHREEKHKRSNRHSSDSDNH